jgi:hypothetical protein
MASRVAYKAMLASAPAPVEHPEHAQEVNRTIKAIKQALLAMQSAAYDEEGYTLNSDLAEAHDDLLAVFEGAEKRLAEPDALHLAVMELARLQHDRIAELDAPLAAKLQEPDQDSVVVHPTPK